MTAIVTLCRKCGADFEPDRETILRGTWRTCPDCRTPPAPGDDDPGARCQQCGRPLRTAGRTICYRCLTGESGL